MEIEGSDEPAAAPTDTKPSTPKPFTPSDELDAPPTADPTPEPAEPETNVPAELRRLYRETKKERDAIMRERDLTRKEAKEYRAKLEDLETRFKAASTAEERLKVVEKDLLDRDERLRVLDYTRSPDFHTKYVKPIADAMEEANERISRLVVNDPNGTRMGTMEDFAIVMKQPNDTKAIEAAAELFGERMAQSVFDMAKHVQSLDRAQTKAMKTAVSDSEQWVKQQQANQAAARQQNAKEFDMAVEQLGQRQSAAYLPPAEDKEAHAVYAKGEEFVSWIRDGAPPGTSREAVLAGWAKIAHRVRSWPLKELAIHRLSQEVETLKARLEAYEKSEPGADGRGESSGKGPSTNQPGDALSAQMRAKLEEYSRRTR